MSELSDQLFCQLNFTSTIFPGRPKRPDLCSCQRWLCSAWYQTCLCVADCAQLVLAVSAFRRSICSSQKRQVTGTSACRPNQAMWTFCRLDRFIIDGARHCRFFLLDYYTVHLLWKNNNIGWVVVLCGCEWKLKTGALENFNYHEEKQRPRWQVQRSCAEQEQMNENICEWKIRFLHSFATLSREKTKHSSSEIFCTKMSMEMRSTTVVSEPHTRGQNAILVPF